MPLDVLLPMGINIPLGINPLTGAGPSGMQQPGGMATAVSGAAAGVHVAHECVTEGDCSCLLIVCATPFIMEFIASLLLVLAAAILCGTASRL